MTLNLNDTEILTSVSDSECDTALLGMGPIASDYTYPRRRCSPKCFISGFVVSSLIFIILILSASLTLGVVYYFEVVKAVDEWMSLISRINTFLDNSEESAANLEQISQFIVNNEAPLIQFLSNLGKITSAAQCTLATQNCPAQLM